MAFQNGIILTLIEQIIVNRIKNINNTQNFCYTLLVAMDHINNIECTWLRHTVDNYTFLLFTLCQQIALFTLKVVVFPME